MEHIISRTMFCPHCNARSSPQKNEYFIVWGSTRQDFFIKKSHQEGISGYTPHIISFTDPPEKQDGKCKLVICCAMHGCGVHISQSDQSFTFERTQIILLELHDFIALTTKWKNSGFELI